MRVVVAHCRGQTSVYVYMIAAPVATNAKVTTGVCVCVCDITTTTADDKQRWEGERETCLPEQRFAYWDAVLELMQAA